MLPSKKLRQLILVILVAAGNLTSYSQAVFSLYAPSDKAVTQNNMPVFSWQKTDCSHYEVWIDGIMMEKVSSERNSCVPFPLSFGKHSWHVMAVNGTNRTKSNVHELTIDDAPLAIVPDGSLLLRHNWQVISSLKAGTDGSELTKAKINTAGWANTSVPATVLTALVRNGIYPNPYMGMNNMRIPDASDEYNSDYDLIKFSHIPGTNPWKNPYWFRNEFTVPAGFKGKMIWLNFGEINYKAEVWLNGKRIADTSEMIGMERTFRFDITRFVKTGESQYPGRCHLSAQPSGKTGTRATDALCRSGSEYGRWRHQPRLHQMGCNGLGLAASRSRPGYGNHRRCFSDGHRCH